ncbi:MAG: PD-(D/E)XK nuclease family protein [Acinetobacter sp.]|nr:PD-(D/E)XK nuclease family protein [Acinetobacter sp.]
MISPNMLKTYELCPRKFYLRYVKNISMPVNDDIFEFGKNIHALASYYLRGENIDKMELSLSEREAAVWNYLKGIKYFGYEVVNTEYNLSLKLGDAFFGGRLDALVKEDDTYYILDYKTGSAPKNAKFDYQTMIYLLAVSKFFKTDKVKFIYIDLKNKEELAVEYSPELGEEYQKRLVNAAAKINSDEIPPKKTECKCEYKAVCF